MASDIATPYLSDAHEPNQGGDGALLSPILIGACKTRYSPDRDATFVGVARRAPAMKIVKQSG